jgi:hypothetical protein
MARTAAKKILADLRRKAVALIFFDISLASRYGGKYEHKNNI